MTTFTFRATSFSAAVLALVFAVSAPATAQLTDSFDVTATVIDSCTLAAGNTLAFGDYDPNAADKDGTTTVSVSCTTGTDAAVGIDGGGAGDTAARVMALSTDPTETLAYQLYSDSGRSTVWGNTTGTDTVSFSGAGVLSTEDLDVYGRIPQGQDVEVGDYSDTVTVSLTIQ